MPEVNFLPQDQIQDKKVRAVSGKLKIFAAFLGFLCLAIAVGGTIFIFYKNNTVTSLQKQESDLKAQILAQESSEQTLVFVRDRLTKIKDIETRNTSNTNFLAEKQAFETFPTTVTLKQLNLTDTDSDFSVTVPDSPALKDILEKVKTRDFADGYVDTIAYNATLGYQIKFKIK